MGAPWVLRWPIVRLAAGSTLVALGCAVEIVEDQNVTTISQSISLPGLLAIILGLTLVVTGYSRMLRHTQGAARGAAFGVGVAVGVALFLTSWWWLFTYGVSADLEAYSVGTLIFGGAALVQVGGRFATVPTPIARVRTTRIPQWTGQPPLFSSRAPRIAVAVALVGGALALLGETALNVGWINDQAATISPVYQIFAVAALGPAAWWLATGYSGLIENVPPGPAGWLGFGGIGAGIAFILGGYAWWSGSSLYAEFGLLIFVLLILAGLGLFLFSASSLRRHTPAPFRISA
jgi:hypothetical protein